MKDLIVFYTAHSVDIATAFFAFLGLFSAIAKLTPTEADNKIVDAILKIVHTFGLTK